MIMHVNRILPTTVVGSLPQPDWLLDRDMLRDRLPAARAHPRPLACRPSLLEAGPGRRDAARHPRHGAGRRRHHHRRRDPPRELLQPLRHRAGRHGPRQPRPRSSAARASPTRSRGSPGTIRRREPVEVRDLEFLRAQHRPPGEDHAARPVHDEPAGRRRALRRRAARSRWTSPSRVNEEVRDLFAAGADVVQIDEPWVQSRPEQAREYAIEVINRALDGVGGTTALHSCFGYAHMVHDRRAGLSDPGRAQRLRRRPARRSRPPSPTSTSSVLEQLAGQDHHRSASSASATSRSSRSRSSPDRIRAALRHVDARAPAGRAGLRHEVPAARRRGRQARRDGPRRRTSCAASCSYSARTGGSAGAACVGCGRCRRANTQVRKAT